MKGIVLAAGGGTRLRPLTDELPKTLLPVDGDVTILEQAVRNLAAVGVDEVVVVTGHAAARIDEVVPTLAATHGVPVRTRFNELFAERNNAYSLWLVTDEMQDATLVVNGDTVHPVSVERQLLDARGQAPLLIALDDVKALAEEEMKVTTDADGDMRRISKRMQPTDASGEYIGVSLIEAAAVPDLRHALQRTFDEDPGRWYEDGYQSYVDAGGRIRPVPIGAVEWVEVDDHDDLAMARSLGRS